MTIARAMSAALFSIPLLAAAPAQADPLQSKKPMSAESITPTAKGPKPYIASKSGVCNSAECSHDFGKKGNKARNIDIVTCGVVVAEGDGLYGFVYIDEAPAYILPISSNETSGDNSFSMIEFQYDFAVREGQSLKVALLTSGNPSSSFCTVGGTIE